jgi:hypothetical protein
MPRTARLDPAARLALPPSSVVHGGTPLGEGHAPALPEHMGVPEHTAPQHPAPAPPAEPDIQYLLDGLAGFFACKADAQAAVLELEQVHGLQPAQLVLLAPQDARRPRYSWLARQWNRRPHGTGRPSAGRFGMVGWGGALVGLMAGLAVLDFDSFCSVELELLSLVAATVCGAALAAGVVELLHSQQPQFIDFDGTVRHKLAGGAWAVLVHDLRWAQQSGAVATMRHKGRDWCAVSSARGQR